MYTLNNTISEILDDEKVTKDFYLYCPKLLIDILSEDQKMLSLAELKNQVYMPWGAPYLSEVVAEAANLVLQLSQDDTLCYTELWSENPKPDWHPIADDGKNGCFLLSRTYEAIAEDQKRPAAIVCPGGAYMTVETINEGFNTFAALEKQGYRVFMLRYRVAPNRWPEPQKDLALAIKTIRANAEAYRIDPDDLMVMRYSAGGHLVASETMCAQEIDTLLTQELERDHPSIAAKVCGISAKANKLCLCYPVISMISDTHEISVMALTQGDEALIDKLSVELHACSDFPKTFLWANDDDLSVPPSNAERLALRLRAVGVPVRYCRYPQGGHGCGLGIGTSCENWLNTMTEWINADESE